jgi:16S rRNA (uracil1498-N3)-methyltransferase
VTDEKLPRVYAPDASEAGLVVALDPAESAHLVRALRLRPGARIVAFDGMGREFLAELSGARGKLATVRLLAPRRPASEPAVGVTVAQALLKGQKMDDVIRDVVMLGAAAVQPLVTARTEHLHAGREPGRRRQRWQRIAAASAGQSGRAVVPAIKAPVSFGDLVSRPPAGLGLMLVEPASGQTGPVALDAGMPVVTLIVGPEGGWSRDEISAARNAGYRLWTLGERTLRADSAAMVALAVLFGRLGEL